MCDEDAVCLSANQKSAQLKMANEKNSYNIKKYQYVLIINSNHQLKKYL